MGLKKKLKEVKSTGGLGTKTAKGGSEKKRAA